MMHGIAPKEEIIHRTLEWQTRATDRSVPPRALLAAPSEIVPVDRAAGPVADQWGGDDGDGMPFDGAGDSNTAAAAHSFLPLMIRPVHPVSRK